MRYLGSPVHVYPLIGFGYLYELSSSSTATTPAAVNIIWTDNYSSNNNNT